MEYPVYLPGWETVELLGEGGFSKVYKIKKVEDGEEFYSALKVINIPSSQSDYKQYLADGYTESDIHTIFKDQVKNIVSEFKMMAGFRGMTNIVSYEDHFIIEEEDKKGYTVYIRMELLETLTDYHMHTPLDEKKIVKLGMDICRALMLCAAENIVHRDIKPQNIFVNKYEDFKLGDFGIAKTMSHTTRATKIGTYSYIAPEVYMGKPYNSKADIYSLGLVLYWLLNERRLPFLPLPPAVPTAAIQENAMQRRLSGDAFPAPLNGSDELKRVILKACAFESEDRFATAEEFYEALEEVKYVLSKSKTKFNVPYVAKKDETAHATSDLNLNQQGGFENEPAERELSPIDRTMPISALDAEKPLRPMGENGSGKNQGSAHSIDYANADRAKESLDKNSKIEKSSVTKEANGAKPSEKNKSDSLHRHEGAVVGNAQNIGGINNDGDSNNKSNDVTNQNSSFSQPKKSKKGKIAVIALFIALVAVCAWAAIKFVSNTDDKHSSIEPTFTVELSSTHGESETTSDESEENIWGVYAGDIVTLGEYEQDNNSSNGKEDIEWVVLEVEVEDGKALIISKYILDYKQYNETQTNVTWETCTLRSWLNNEFFNSAFVTTEQRGIIDATVVTPDTPTYGTEGGNDTVDKIFLLSLAEAEKYFTSNESRSCIATEYAKNSGLDVNSRTGASYWWLRSAGKNQSIATDVDQSGNTNYLGQNVVLQDGVRPALWINLDVIDLPKVPSGDAVSHISVGDTMVFGTYEQDNDMSNGAEDIKWEVLEVKDGKALVISKYALDCKRYNIKNTDITWETCTLRSWLNNDFYNKAFSSAEKDLIQSVTITNSDNPYYGTNGGNNTTDKVFLLSIEEAVKYYAPDKLGELSSNTYISTNGAAQCTATAYAEAQWVQANPSNKCSWYWLRSPGYYPNHAAYVFYDGDVLEYGEYVNYDAYAVRPALWIDLNP